MRAWSSAKILPTSEVFLHILGFYSDVKTQDWGKFQTPPWKLPHSAKSSFSLFSTKPNTRLDPVLTSLFLPCFSVFPCSVSLSTRGTSCAHQSWGKAWGGVLVWWGSLAFPGSVFPHGQILIQCKALGSAYFVKVRCVLGDIHEYLLVPVIIKVQGQKHKVEVAISLCLTHY